MTAAPSAGAVSWARKRLGFALRLAFTLAALWGCLALIELEHLLAALDGLSLAVFLLAAAINALGTILIPAAITKLALKIERIALTLRELVAINLAVRFYVLALPRAAATAVRWWRYSRAGRGDDALALMIFERVVQLLVLTFAATLFLALDRARLGETGLALGVVAALAFLATAGLFAAFLSPAVFGLAQRLLRPFERLLPAFIAPKAAKLAQAIARFRGIDRASVLAVVGLSLLGFAAFVVSPFLLAQDLGLDVSIYAMAWIRSLVFLLTLIPITVGGIGVREAAFVGFLQLYGVPAAEALAFSFVVLAIQLAIGALGGGLELWRHWLRPSLAPRAAARGQGMGPA